MRSMLGLEYESGQASIWPEATAQWTVFLIFIPVVFEFLFLVLGDLWFFTCPTEIRCC